MRSQRPVPGHCSRDTAGSGSYPWQCERMSGEQSGEHLPMVYTLLPCGPHTECMQKRKIAKAFLDCVAKDGTKPIDVGPKAFQS